MEDDEGVRVIRLAHGKVNALDLELTEALVDHFGQLGEASDVRAVVPLLDHVLPPPLAVAVPRRLGQVLERVATEEKGFEIRNCGLGWRVVSFHRPAPDVLEPGRQRNLHRV